MTQAILVIDGRKDGLPHAPNFYATFPQEPSPFGTLTLDPKTTTVMRTDASLFAALPALTKAGSGGAAVLVSHAYSGGLLLPVAPNGQRQFADSTGLPIIDKAIDAEAEHAKILALPRSTDAERKAVLDRWTTFLNGLGATITGQFTEAEAEAQYAKWLEMVAKSLEFANAAAMRPLLARVLALRAAKLDRIELRACNVGGDQNAMKRLQTFFGCGRLTAPTVGTFFATVPVGPLVATHTPRRVHGPSQSAIPAGQSHHAEAVESAALLTETGSTRGFLMTAFGPLEAGAGVDTDYNFPLYFGPFLGLSPFHMRDKVFRFILRVVEVKAFEYKLWAWAIGSPHSAAPDPQIIKEFCALAFKNDTLFTLLQVPVAGLWTPNAPKPYVLPLEDEYLPLIAKLGAATP